MASEVSGPFFGLKDFLIRHTAPDETSALSCRRIFIAYRAYMTRKRPDIIISMDFARFCSYLEYITPELGFKKTAMQSIDATLYHVRFRSLKKLHKSRKRKAEKQDLQLPIRDINVHICCKICCGYLVNASTITECLHSFCKSCIVKHFRVSQRCPVCDIMVHETTPLAYVRFDVKLQDIVNRILPGLEKCEEKREIAFYKEHGDSTPFIPLKPEDIFKPIQFMLEWVGLKHCTLMAAQIPDKYIRVSARATVGHVAQFVLEKLKNLDADSKPTVYCDIKTGGVTLPPILTLDAIEKHHLDFEKKKDWLLLQYDIRPLEEE